MTSMNKEQPWLTEPDSESIGAGDLYPRYIKRAPHSGHLCGYIAFPPDHPWAAMSYDDIPCSVHGGLTYFRPAAKFFEPEAFPAGWSVFGFDCAHGGDMAPRRSIYSGEYRTIEYVREQLLNLARQAKAAEIALTA